MNLFILGATGSIGIQTLDIVRRSNGQLNVISVTGNRNIEKMREIILEFHPLYVSMGKRDDVDVLQKEFPKVAFGVGNEGLIAAASYGDKGNDLVVNAIVGSAGLLPTVAAIKKGRNVALANKETLVIGGELIKKLLEQHHVTLLPIDSEHSAIMQCLNGEDTKEVERIIITASGGSFRDKTRHQLKNVTVQDALQHPNWSMGAKITIDSATMMNKGLEVIEAHYLFDVGYEQIETIMHKESIIHSMVEFKDTSVIAHLGMPDMRVPINYAIHYPNRTPYRGERLDLKTIGALHFAPLSYERYPLLQLAIDAGKKGGYAPCVLNAANEAAVQLFLQGKITFLQIEDIVRESLQTMDSSEELTIEKIIEKDQEVKDYILRQYS